MLQRAARYQLGFSKRSALETTALCYLLHENDDRSLYFSRGGNGVKIIHTSIFVVIKGPGVIYVCDAGSTSA